MSTTMQRLSGSISSPSVLTGRLGIAFMPAPTGDATASADDILVGETAYIATGKVTGTYTPLDTSDGTAIPSDILDSKIAYVDGERVIGTCLFDADTSDGTATEGDIRTGTSAYVNGAKLDGSLTPLDTSSATATASDILTGKTAYISDGTEATGTCDFDADTSSGDAVAADIAAGKVAWVDGEEVTGTSTFDADTSDADATAADILATKTAYAGGAKVTGTVTDAIVVKTRDESYYPLTVDYYGTKVGLYAFWNFTNAGCWKLMTGITFKNALTYIGAGAFARCAALVITDIPIGVTVLPHSTFLACISIVTINAPGVNTMQATNGATGAFYACTALTTATIGSTGHPATTLSVYSFSGCTSAGTLTVYTADGNALATSPYGWVGTVVHTQS